ncbi:bifunctional aldolase/short-chain dehydrogenase [Membranicola marinus]|uniref:Bifunctional aldolase/short-chain dehydrogenase n=1 Tax=Membranihabitans marinus TaxID=1227546 RepID=A0A953I1M8_9BACT|nr:bifunctional aldolase/short-chain dehydrogenase [Membranihabitans marinus]MBY5959642.1 bifunctional aldolase/short-chain dehydrogenase [Membranihabitans marinus]
MTNQAETKKYKYVDYLWDKEKEESLGDDQVKLFLYRSNLLGADLRITNYGGGNTSCRTMEKDPLTGEEVEVMWIKGSGGDIGTLDRNGIAGLYVDKLHDLKNVYTGIDMEDEMVALLYHCLYDLDSRAPSIDTPLHGLIPFKHIDHLHPDAVIAIAAAENGEEITKELWNGEIGWLPWQRPGFDLGVQMENYLKENPDIRGLILGSHGLFTWGDTAHECYVNSLETIEQASEYIENAVKKNGQVFGGQKIQSLEQADRKDRASRLMPILRGLCSEENAMIGHFNDSDRVLEFINSNDLDKLAPLGTSCPDHFLRTKIQPLVLNMVPDESLEDRKAVKEKITGQFEEYRAAYADYYEKHKRDNSPAMRDANPVVILYPGVGMFTFAKNKQTARVAAEFYVNAVNVMRGSEAISTYTALPRQEAFDIEYWLLEEAKLKRMPAEKPLSRKVALITGGGGGIGQAIAEKLAAEGANVFITDIREDRASEVNESFGRDVSAYDTCNVTDEEDVDKAFRAACLAFGGVDIVVHSAGLAISKPIQQTTMDDWNLLQDVLVKGQFLLSRSAAEVFEIQDMGGDIVNIASKNGLVSGPNNVGYGTAKAAQMHMSRLLAAELAQYGVRVNTVNPDGVIIGSKIWEGDWAEGRAKAYGISVNELPQHYANRNLLKKIIRPSDIAKGVFAVTAILDKSTGNIINVDGGMPGAFPR